MYLVKAFALCLLPLCLYGVQSEAQAPAIDNSITVNLDPSKVDVGLFYRGSDLEIEAHLPACDGAVAILESEAESTTLNRKGREAGIWLNVAKVTISNAPKVYLLASSDPLETICSDSVRGKLGLGIDALRERLRVTSEKELIGAEGDEFLRLKTEAGVYNTQARATLSPNGSGNLFSAILPIPATIPPDQYRVSIYCFTGGALTNQGSSPFTIERVGLVATMTSLARQREAVYGVMAIVIAMTVGITMGFVFHSRTGAGH